MKPRRRSGSTSQCCSCTSCLYTSESEKFSIRRYIAHDSRASQLYFETYIPLREQNLLNKFVRTEAVFDDLKSRLICDGILDPEKNTYLRPGKPVTNSLESKQNGVLDLVDNFERGVTLNACKRCSSCSCLSKVKILGVKDELKRKKNSARIYEAVSGQTRQIGKRENIYVRTYERKIGETERGRTRERHNKRGIRFKAKYIRSDPCTCTLKYSGLIKKQSKAMIRQIRHVPYVLDEPVIIKKQNFTRKSYQISKKRQDKLEQFMFNREMKLRGTPLSKSSSGFQAKKFAKAKRARISQLMGKQLEMQYEEVNKISMKDHGRPQIAERSVDFGLSATFEEYDSCNSKEKHNFKSLNKVLKNKLPKAVRKTEQFYLCDRAVHIKSQFNFDVEFYKKAPESKTSQTNQPSEIHENIPIHERQKKRYQHKGSKIVVKPSAEASIGITQMLNARLIQKDKVGDSDIVLKPNNLVFERIQYEKSLINIRTNTDCGNKTLSISKKNGDTLKPHDIFASQKPALRIGSKLPFNVELIRKIKENDVKVTLTDRKIKETLSSLTIKKRYASREVVKVNRICIKACRNAKSALHKCFRILKLHGKSKTKKKNEKSAAVIHHPPSSMINKNVRKKNYNGLKIAEAFIQPCKCASDIGIRREYDPIFDKNVIHKNTSNSVGLYVNSGKSKSTSGIVPRHFTSAKIAHSYIVPTRMGKMSAPIRYKERLNFGQNKIQKTDISSLGKQAVHIRSCFSLNIEFHQNRLALSASNKPSLSNTARGMKYPIFKNGGNKGSSIKKLFFALKLYKNILNKMFLLQNTEKLTINTQTVGEAAMGDTDNKRIKTKKRLLYKLLPFKRRLHDDLPSFHLNTQDNCTVKPEMTPVRSLTGNFLLKYDETLEHSGSISTETNIKSTYTQPKSPYFAYTRRSGEIIDATKAKQAVKIKSRFNFSIELSTIIPGAVDLATYPKQVEIQKQLGQDKGKSVTKERTNYIDTQVPELRKRAALVRPMLKRCFCTLNLQKKNKNQHYTSNSNFPSVIHRFGSNVYAVGRAMTAETQFMSHKFGLEGGRKCQLFGNRNKLMSVSASSFLLNKYINSLELKYSNLKIYSIFKIPKQFNQPLTIKSNLSMTVKIIQQLDFCNIPTLNSEKNSLEQVHDSLRIIEQKSNQGQKMTGIGRYLERNFCTMNVNILNAGVPPNVNGISDKIKPYECECQCDPYERKKYIKRQNVKNAHKCSGANKVISRTCVGNYPQQRRETVRVGSSFSFNLEFFKTQTEPSDNMRQHETRSGRKRSLDQNKYKTVSKGCQGKSIKISDSENKGSQEKRIQRLDKQVQKTAATVDKASGVLRNRGICTFKLQKRGRIYKEDAKLKQNDTAKPQTTKPKNAKICTETKYRKKIIDLNNPKSCEYEQGDHVPEDGVPHKCLGVMKNHNFFCINTKREKESVSSTRSQEHSKAKNKTHSVNITQNTNNKITNAVKCTKHSDNTNVHISGDGVPHKYVQPMKNHKDFGIYTKREKESVSGTRIQEHSKAKNKTRPVDATRNTNHNKTNAVKCTKYNDNTNVHVPGDGVPHKHVESMKNHKDFGINTKSVKESISSTSQEHLKAKYKTRSVDTTRNTNHKSINAVKYTKHNDNTHPAISERKSRPVVRIESNFSFNIEIAKDTPQFQSNQHKGIIKDTKTGKVQINPKKKVISCACQTAKVHSDKNINVKSPYKKFHTATEPKLHSTEIQNKRNTTSFKEKIFCWLGLRKKGNKDNQPSEQVEKRRNRNNNVRYTEKAAQTTERIINKKQRQKGQVSSQFARHISPLDQCDPYFCNEIIQENNIKQDSKGSGDESVQTQSRSFGQHKRSKNEKIQVQSQTNNLKQKQHRSKIMPSGKMIVNNNELDKRLVRIGSNISFNIEFYKDNLNGNNINDTAKGVNKTMKKSHPERKEKRLTLKNTTTETPKSPSVRSNESQVSKEYKTSEFNPLVKSCFCNLDLKNTQMDKLKKTVKKSQKDIKPTIITKSIETQSKGEKFKNHFQDIPQNLSLYEYEPFVHETDERVSVQCLKQIKKKQEQTKDYGVATDYPKSKSIGSIATRMRNENLQTNIPRGVTNVVRKINHIGESYNRLATSRRPSRQAVRIGSNFSFNIEFFKDFGNGKPQIEVMQQQLQDTHNYSKKVLQRQTKYQLPHLRNNVNSQAMATTMNSAENGMPHMKKCFYTLQLQNDKLNNHKNISMKNQSDQPKSDHSSVGKFLRKCVCTLGLNKIGKLQNRRHTPAVQYKIKNTSTDSQLIPKDRIEKLTKLLERYENEPYFCVPRYTYDYLKWTQRRQVRDVGTNNKRNLKDSATYSVRKPVTKSTKVQCHKYRKLNSRGTYFSKSHRGGKEIAQFSPNIDNQGQKHHVKGEQPRSTIKPCGKLIVNNNESDKRLVRIGSNFSFSVEFFKENRKANTDFPNKKPKKEPKFRTRSKKIRGKPRGSVTRTGPSYKSAQSQSSKNRKKNFAANTVPKISLPKQKLFKNGKPPKSNLENQPNTIKTKDKFIATKVKCGVPRASGVPNLRHFHSRNDRNDSLDKINIREIMNKSCIVGTRPERKSTASVGSCRCKLKAQKKQFQTAKQRNTCKHKNVAAKTGIFRHNNVQMDSIKLKDQRSGAGNLFKKGRCTLKLQKPARRKESGKSCKRKTDTVYPQKFTVRTAIIKPFHKDLKICPFKETARVRSVYNKIYLRNAKSNMQIILPYAPSKVNRKSSNNLDEDKSTIGFSGQGKRILTAKKIKKSSLANTTGRKSKENSSFFCRCVRFFTRKSEVRPKDTGLQKNIKKMYDNYEKPTRLKSCLVPKMGNQKTTMAIFGDNCFYICPNKMKESRNLIMQSGDVDYNLNKIDNDQSKKREIGPKLNSVRPKMHVTFADIIKSSRNDILNGKRKKITIYKSKTRLCCSCSVNGFPYKYYNLNGGHQIMENFHVFGKNKMKSSKKFVSYSESVDECQYSMCSKRNMSPCAIESVNVKTCKRYSGPCIGESKKCALELKRKKNKRSFVKQGLRCERIKKCSNAGDVLVRNLGISTVTGAINNTEKSISDLKVSCEKCKLSKKRYSDSINKTSQKIQEDNIRIDLAAATAKRTNMGSVLMVTEKTPQQKLEKNSVTHFNTHIAYKHPKSRQLKWIRRVREPVDFQYNYYMASLRNRRHLNVIFKCPWFRFHFLNMFNVWKKITNVMLFLLSAVMWSPCIICRALLCCFYCSGSQ